MRNQLLLIITIITFLGFFGCSKDKPSEKLCSQGVLIYNDGDKFLTNPTAISPNSDQINDYFKPITNIHPDSFSFRIIHPNGSLVFQSSSKNQLWEVGNNNEKNVYEYYVETTIKKSNAQEVINYSPLFILIGSEGQCISNARKEDINKYFFEDQYYVNKGFVVVTRECFKL
jgi:hypothetical protein